MKSKFKRRSTSPATSAHVDFGGLIRRRRVELSVKASEVARSAGISRAYLSMLETGRNPKTRRPSRPSPEVIVKLAGILQMNAGILMEAAGYFPALARSPSTRDKDSTEALGRLKAKIEDLRREAIRIPVSSTPYGEEHFSGIKGFVVRPGDHILLLSQSPSTKDFTLSVRFVVEGLKRRDAGVIRLPQSASANLLGQIIRKKVGPKRFEQLALVPWSEGVLSHYRPGRFSREDTVRAHAEDLSRLPKRPGSLVRFATPDASDYFSWVKNPRDVLDYEHVWADDLHDIDPGRRFILLCLYRLKDLKKQEKGDFSLTSMILELLNSHNRIIFLTGDNTLYFDGAAVKEILGRMDLKLASTSVWQKMGAVGNKYNLWGE